MTNVWISAIGLCGATMIGSLLGFGIKELPHKWNDTVLGYCAGIMLAASTLGLIVPAFDGAGVDGWWMVVIGLLEVVGVWLGYSLGSASATFLPVMLGFTGGAMLYVTSDEMIPEPHTHGYQKQATYALLLGFMALLLLERFFE